ncbi:hypothetical protein K402DRAFT_392343 [Aulographum hederae CBS 113979]|uniref:Shugoshin n=1 Tax=Aulographum hederae CBS 113979 TaxID=1176131 RepID=A0A6G1H4X2_9PEZI|nr:hypothetical protein K402DRAFT_392343 [Aulographum hederae CBS 113979]
MARLNEPPVPIESVDSLKRRFIRQNRELAKNNSNQSVRIRNLEAETSRLLSDNLVLREQVLQLQHELEKKESTIATESINAVKSQLEAKLQELGTLVADLGQPQKPPSKGKRRSSSSRLSNQWRERLPGLDPEAEGRLPTIAEDKYYPRKTLDAQQIQALADPALESPDLGPPPVAHFDDEDPIKFDPQVRPVSEDVAEEPPVESLPVNMSVNLETRRRRKDSQPRSDMRRMSVFQSPPEAPTSGAITEPGQNLPIRTGAKRKLSARDDDGASILKVAEDFAFSRKSGSEKQLVQTGQAPSDGVDSAPPPLPETVEKSRKERPIARLSSAASDRRILGDKSVNADPVISPRKMLSEDQKPALKKPGLPLKDAARNRIRERRVKSASDAPVVNIPPPPSDDKPIETIDLGPDTGKLLPKTPAGFDLFSPTNSDPSTAKPSEPKDTPPPGDINPAGADAAGRVGRRARSAVSYAEPKLNTKMRRPGKELMDAVATGTTKANPMRIDEGKSDGESKEPYRGRSITIKREPRDDDGGSAAMNWKNLPMAAPATEDAASPLSKKAGAGTSREEVDDAAHQVKERRQELASAPTIPSASSAAISALIAGSAGIKKKKEKVVPHVFPAIVAEVMDVTETDEKRASLAIFDYTESSPPAEGGCRNGAPAAPESFSRSRGSRRHSSVPSLTSAMQDLAANGKSTDTGTGTKETRTVSRSRSTRDSRIGKPESNALAGDEAQSRVERAASRRRSMMI